MTQSNPLDGTTYYYLKKSEAQSTAWLINTMLCTGILLLVYELLTAARKGEAVVKNKGWNWPHICVTITTGNRMATANCL